jgi:hypothetical protein
MLLDQGEMPSMIRTAFLPGLLLLACISPAKGAEPTPREIFEKRLLPIFKSPNPSSCVQCHLAGVELKDYILPDHEKTFRNLRDQGLIDLDSPEKSQILALIRRGGKDNRGAALIHAKTRKVEYEAFSAWIKSCCADDKLRQSPPLEEKARAKPTRPIEVIRHARKDRLLSSFERNVWALRFRCMGCHTEGTPQCDKNVKEHGERVAWFKKAGARATMDYLLGSKLIDPKSPEKSLLLRKPLGEVKHGGGIKIQVGDQGYKALRAWIEDVWAIRGNRYAKVEDLPPEDKEPIHFGSDIWLKLSGTPADWGDRLLQVSLYAWDADKKAWEKEPIATSDRRVWGKGKLWQHTLTLLAMPGSKRANSWKKGMPALPPGRYRLEVHVDAKDKLSRDWKARLTQENHVGQAELTSNWREGYGAMTVLDAGKVRR